MAKQLNVDMRFNADTSQAKRAIQDLQNSLSTIAKMPGNASNLFDDIIDILNTEIQEITSIIIDKHAYWSYKYKNDPSIKTKKLYNAFIRINNGLSLSIFVHKLTSLNKSVSISQTSLFAPLP